MLKARELIVIGRLHEKHVVSPWKLRDTSTFPWGQSYTKNTFVELGGFRNFRLHNTSCK